MSKIESIKQNYQQKQQNRNVIPTMPRKNYQNPNFGGATDKELQILAEKLSPEIEGPLGKFSHWLGKHDGEVPKQCINGIFTATLAPLVIGWNPFSKQDENTKKYSALRQPISAVIAVAGGWAMTSPIDRWQERIASQGYIPSIDLRMKPDEKYLKKLYIKDKGMFNGKKMATEKEYLDEVAKKRKDLFQALLGENPQNIGFNEATKQIYLVDSKKNIGQNIPNINSKADLDKLIAKHNLHNVDFKTFMEEELKFQFYKDGSWKPKHTMKRLKDIKAIEFLEKTGLVKKGEFKAEEFSKFLAKKYQNKKDVGVVAEVQKGLKSLPENAEKIVTALAKDGTRNIERRVGEHVTTGNNMTLRQLFRDLRILDDNGIVDKEFKEITRGKMSESLIYFRDRLSGMKTDAKGTLIETMKTADFAKNLLPGKIDRLTSRFKAFKDHVGIFSNVFIVAITCTALNWAYPRIVEKVAPNLVKDDTKKGGNK